MVFGQDAFTQAPLTLDHQVLEKFIDNIYINMAGRGTSIGPAIATSVKRLQGLDVKSKIVILLTDGRDSGQDIDPVEAARAARFWCKIYSRSVEVDAAVSLAVFIVPAVSWMKKLSRLSLPALGVSTQGRKFGLERGLQHHR